MEEYTRYSVCSNCKFLGDVSYRKGQCVGEKSCPDCECLTLQAIGEYEKKMSHILGYKTTF